MTRRGLWWLSAIAILLVGCSPKERPDDRILFGPKRFNVIPFGPGLETIAVSGTLTGEGIDYANNSVLIYCRQEAMDCWIVDIAQVGPNQIGDLQIPTNYAVTRWDADVVVMGSANLYPCRRETISIQKRTQSVVWVQEPINQTDANCLKSDTKLYKWTIDDSPKWRAMFHAKN